MAKRFLQDVLRDAKLRLKVAWRIEDDSTISESNLHILKELGIIAIAHSIHKNANTTLYKTFVPNFHFIETHGFRKLIHELENPEVPLQHRRPSVFWAGSTTGLPCGSVKPCENTCDNIQRVKLVQLGNALTWTSFSITRAIQWCTSDALQLQDLTTEYVKELDWIQHRGLIDVDGNVDAWGLTWRLASGSVVFRVRSSYLNYFSDRIVEGVHFLSIAEDLSDLAEVTSKITLMRDLDQLSRISQNAKKVVLEHSYETIVDTVSKVLAGKVSLSGCTQSLRFCSDASITTRANDANRVSSCLGCCLHLLPALHCYHTASPSQFQDPVKNIPQLLSLAPHLRTWKTDRV